MKAMINSSKKGYLRDLYPNSQLLTHRNPLSGLKNLKMTAPKCYFFIFNLENVAEILADRLIPDTSVEMTFIGLIFVAAG